MLGFGAISTSPISTLPQWSVVFLAIGTLDAAEGFDAKVYVATREYITLSTDTPPNTPFLGTLTKLPRMDRTIINSSGFNGVTLSWGEAEINNTDAEYDFLVPDYTIDGQPTEFKTGDPTGAYNSFFPVVSLIATGMTVDDEAVRIQYRDKSFRLDVPAQSSIYAGTGDLEGGPDLANKRKPLAFGFVKNITPAYVIPAEDLYQVHDGRVYQIFNVYDTGFALNGPNADYATVALLRAALIPDGWFSTCSAQGWLRTGSPASQLTCDLVGDAPGGVPTNTSGTIVRRLLALATDFYDPDELDVVSFENLETEQPATINYYIDPQSSKSVADVIADIMTPIGGWGGMTRLGMMQVGIFKAPAGTPIASYDETDVIDAGDERLPSGIDPVPYRQRVAWNRNWTIIDNPLPAVAVTDPARAAWLGLPYKTASTSQADADEIQNSHTGAQDPPVIEAHFDNEAPALLEANRKLTLFNSGYPLTRVVVADHPYLHDIGQTVRLSDLRRIASGGKLARIASVSDDPDSNMVELRVFG